VTDEHALRPAFYAARPGKLRGWWTILHLPYTAWHLSYVALGAGLAPHVDGVRLTATLLAFFLAVGIAAHALDELHGHPLATGLPDRSLWIVSSVALAGAVTLGAIGLERVGLGLIAFIALGCALVLAYNLEWFGGRLHNDVVFALAWGTFPVLTSYYAQAERLGVVAVTAGVAAFFLSSAQRALSSRARDLRRRVVHVDGSLTRADGSVEPVDARALLQPLEVALASMAAGVVALAIAVLLLRLT
jgi:hypothetical protein